MSDDATLAAGAAMRRGDFVRITYGGRTLRGMVLLASPNGASLMLAFDGALVPSHGEGMFVGYMPALRDDAGVYRDLICGEEVGIEADAKQGLAR